MITSQTSTQTSTHVFREHIRNYMNGVPPFSEEFKETFRSNTAHEERFLNFYEESAMDGPAERMQETIKEVDKGYWCKKYEVDRGRSHMAGKRDELQRYIYISYKRSISDALLIAVNNKKFDPPSNLPGVIGDLQI